MDDASISSKPRRNVLFYLASGLAVLTTVLFFYWIFNLNRKPSSPVVPSGTVVTETPVAVVATQENVVPTETPSLPDPASGAGITTFLPNTRFTIINRPEFRAGMADAPIDRLEFIIDGALYRFQLPGIEALITSTGKPDRRATQAGIFKSNAEQIGMRGDNARDWLYNHLKEHPYKIFTDWKAVSESEPDVYWAHIFVEHGINPVRWSFLTELLLARGEARLTGQPLWPPLGMASEKDFTERHRQSQAFAQKQKLGAWSSPTEESASQ